MAFKHEKQLRLLAIHRNLEWPARTILQRFSKFCRSVVYTDDERDKQLAHTHTNTHIHTHKNAHIHTHTHKKKSALSNRSYTFMLIQLQRCGLAHWLLVFDGGRGVRAGNHQGDQG